LRRVQYSTTSLYEMSCQKILRGMSFILLPRMRAFSKGIPHIPIAAFVLFALSPPSPVFEFC
jgi:hypothetical protein